MGSEAAPAQGSGAAGLHSRGVAWPAPPHSPGAVSPLPSQVPRAARCLRCGRWAGGRAAAHPGETDGRHTHGTASAQCRALQTAGLGCLLAASRIYRTPFPSSGILVSTVGRGRTPTELSTGPARRRQRLWGGPVPGGYTISVPSFGPQGKWDSSARGRPHICFLPSSSPQGEGPALLHGGGKLRPQGAETCPR